jgi:hypothetical protein
MAGEAVGAAHRGDLKRPPDANGRGRRARHAFL